MKDRFDFESFSFATPSCSQTVHTEYHNKLRSLLNHFVNISMQNVQSWSDQTSLLCLALGIRKSVGCLGFGAFWVLLNSM